MFLRHGKWGLSFSLEWEGSYEDIQHVFTIKYGRHYLIKEECNGAPREPYWVCHKSIRFYLPFIQWPHYWITHNRGHWNQLHFNHKTAEFNPDWQKPFKY